MIQLLKIMWHAKFQFATLENDINNFLRVRMHETTGIINCCEFRHFSFDLSTSIPKRAAHLVTPFLNGLLARILCHVLLMISNNVFPMNQGFGIKVTDLIKEEHDISSNKLRQSQKLTIR